MIRKIIHTQQESVITLELPENLKGKRIEVIAFEIEENIPAIVGVTSSSLNENGKKWHTVEESEAIVLEAVKKRYASLH